MLDQSELEWFLSEGITLFERSTTGAILDKIAMDAFTSRRCHICDGEGIIKRDFKIRAGRNNTKEFKSGDWCFKCGGTGAVPVRLTPDEQSLVSSGDFHVRETDSFRAAVPDAAIARYAVVSRRLSRMPRCLAVAISAAYGDEGESSSLTARGRAWAVAQHTPAGRRLLELERNRKIRTKGVEAERPYLALTELARMDGSKAKPERTALLAEASTGAVRLLEKAEHAWIRVSIEDGRSRTLRNWIKRACQGM